MQWWTGSQGQHTVRGPMCDVGGERAEACDTTADDQERPLCLSMLWSREVVVLPAANYDSVKRVANRRATGAKKGPRDPFWLQWVLGRRMRW